MVQLIQLQLIQLQPTTTTVAEEEEKETTTNTTVAEEDNTMMYIGIGVAVLLVLGVIGFVFNVRWRRTSKT